MFCGGEGHLCVVPWLKDLSFKENRQYLFQSSEGRGLLSEQHSAPGKPAGRSHMQVLVTMIEPQQHMCRGREMLNKGAYWKEIAEIELLDFGVYLKLSIFSE